MATEEEEDSSGALLRLLADDESLARKRVGVSCRDEAPLDDIPIRLPCHAAAAFGTPELPVDDDDAAATAAAA
jgi:hypothetical protein